MNIIDAVSLTSQKVISDTTNMLVWDQETGDASRLSVKDFVDEVSDNIDISEVTDTANQAYTVAKRVSSRVTGLEADMETLKSDIDTVQSENYAQAMSIIQGDIGKLNTLKTDNKSTIVAAINETYNKIDEVRSSIPTTTTTSTSTSTIDVLSAYGNYYVDDQLAKDSGSSSFDPSKSSNSSTTTASVQKLIDNAYQDGGGTIVFGNKIYVIDNLTLRSKVILKGAGRGATILQKKKNNQTKFIFVPETETAVGIEDMTILGNLANDTSNKTGAGVIPDDNATCHGVYFEDMLLANGKKHDNNNKDKNGNDLPLVDPYQALYVHDKIDSSRTWTYRNSSLINVAIIGFTGSGLYVGEVNFGVFVFNGIFYLNKKHGMELWGSDSYYIQILCERNGFCGIFSEAGNTKFMCIKSIWNSWDVINTKFTDSNEISKILPDPNQQHVVRGEYRGWGIFAFCSRSSFIDVEVQDNFCSGIYIRGDNAQFQNLISDCNGYGQINPNLANPPQQYSLIRVRDSHGIQLNAVCSQYKTLDNGTHKPVAKYGLLLGSCFNSIINCSCVFEGVNQCAVKPYFHDAEENYGVSDWFHGNVITIVGIDKNTTQTGTANKYLGMVSGDNYGH